jgi:enoyl-CoA hydratase
MTELIVRRVGRVGYLTLDRPAALHALTQTMCDELLRALSEFERDPAIELVLLDHAGERGFCAGGDIRALIDSVAGDGVAARQFFRTEYQLDHLLFTYEKPVVVFMDGIVMGGGAGIALPCRYRIATERTRFAMPECGIGFFPDVGSSWYLPRLPRHAGRWLALTGSRIAAADCMFTGLTTHYVLSAALPELKQRIIAEPRDFETTLLSLSGPAEAPPLAADIDSVEAAFGAATLPRVLEQLQANGKTWANEQLVRISSKAPLSLAAAWRLLQVGAEFADFAHNLAGEYALAVRMVQQPDFSEGVRTTLLDRSKQPAWQPADLAAISSEMLDALFAPLPVSEAWRALERRTGRGG